MRRPRPLRRLIDGSPDASGRAVGRRAMLLLIPAILVANAVGATVVFVLAAFVIPVPEVEDTTGTILLNLGAASVYLVAALIAGTVWGWRRFAPTREWLASNRQPSTAEQRRMLRIPLRLLVINGVLWGLGAVLAGLLNVFVDAKLGVIVGTTTLLGGVTTCAVVYLLSERLQRPVAARALECGAPERPVLPGVVTRGMLAWALGSGVPIVGLMFVAIAYLLGQNISERAMATTILGLGGLALLVGLLVTWLTARATADPVVSVREALHDVEEGNFETEVPVYDGSELGLLQAGFNRMVVGLRDREELRDLFGRQVGEDVARAALDRGVELGGEVRDVAILFVDVIGSTSMASDRPPHEVVSMLNRFFGIVVDVVDRNGGWVNKFEGDAALAVFGAPMEVDAPYDRALAAARELADRLRADGEGLEAGIGVSAGEAVAGNIGDERRFEYTVIGDPVNEAARLTELAKDAPGRVLASGAIIERAEDGERGRWELGDEVRLRGRSSHTRVAAPL